MQRKHGFRFFLGGMAFTAACASGPAEPDRQPTTFKVLVENVSAVHDFPSSGAFNTPVGDSAPGPLMPGSSYEMSFYAGPGSRVSFASMFVQSNDLFFAPAKEGIALFDEQDMPRSGDITGEVMLWDAGTEANEEPGAGAYQAPSQAGANMGDVDADSLVRLATDDFDNLPAVQDVIAVTLSSHPGNRFVVTINNVSSGSTLQFAGGESAVLLAPGVFAVHQDDAPLFTPGASASGEGLEMLAEDGNPGPLAAAVAARTGITGPLAPGAWAVHDSGMALFTNGGSDWGMGLEGLAEDGDPSTLASSLEDLDLVTSSGAFNTPIGAAAPGPVFSGQGYEFTISAEPGQQLSLATMFVQSNDLFYSFGDTGIALFDANGDAVSGDQTSALSLWDVGTERNESPGAGPNQAPRQSAAATGDAEDGKVMMVADDFEYPAAADFVRVTVTPM